MDKKKKEKWHTKTEKWNTMKNSEIEQEKKGNENGGKKGRNVFDFMDTSFLRHTSTSWKGWLGMCGGLWSGFLCTIVTLMPETASFSFRTLAFLFPLATDTFSSFNATHSLLILDHSSCFNSPVSGVKISHHCLQFSIIRHRYLLMNLHVVQLQYSFKLSELTYSQFVQTLQEIIRWNLWHW